LSVDHLISFTLIFILLSGLFGFAGKIMNQSFKKFIFGFSIIFMLGVLALVMSSQVTVKAYGFGYSFDKVEQRVVELDN